jgi:hypothetical protein
MRGFSAALHDSYLRDAVLMNLLGALDEEVAALLAGSSPDVREQVPDIDQPDRAADHFGRDLGRLLWRRPDEQQLRVGQTVLAAAARVADDGDRGPALAVLAMLGWMEGRGGRARLLLERSRADAPAISLAGLVGDLLEQRIPPPWRRSRPDG